MNKLLRKIAKLTLGLAMAAGVGVAIFASQNKIRTTLADVGDVIATADFSGESVPEGWTASSDGYYSNKGLKLKTANSHYAQSPNFNSQNKTDVKVGVKAGYNTASGSVLTIAAYSNSNQLLDSDTFTPNQIYTTAVSDFTENLSELSGGDSVIAYVKVTLTTKVNNTALVAVTVYDNSSDDTPSDPLDGKTGTIKFGSATGSVQLSSSNLSGYDSLAQEWVGTDVWTSGYTKSFTNNAGYTQIGASTNTKRITSITFEMQLAKAYKITAFSVKTGGYTETAGSATLKVDTTPVGTGSISSSDTTLEASDTEQEGTTLTVILAATDTMRFKLYQISYSLEAISDADETTTALSVNPGTWSGYNSDTISLSSFTVTCTTSAEDDGYEFQGIGSGSGDNFEGRDADKTSFMPRTTDTRLQWKAKYPQTAGDDDYLYAYVTLTVSQDSVSSVSASVSSGTRYVGSKLLASDFTVSAVWAHSGNKPVTSDFTWTVNGVSDGSLTNGENTVVVTYGGVSSSSIIVNAQYERGTDVSAPLGVEETISGYSTYSGKAYYVEGYIREWHVTQGNDYYAFITDAKNTTTGDNAKRIEIYGTLNFVSGNQAQYVLGSKITAYGLIGEYSGKKEVMNSNSKIDIWVTEVETADSLTIKTQPDTDTYSVGGYFDPTGLVVTVEYESRSVDVEYNNNTASGFTFVPSLQTALTAQDTTVQVTYEGVSANVSIEIDSAVHTNSVTLKIGNETAPESLTRALDAGNLVLSAALDPSNSEDALTWGTSDSTIATVSSGTVTFGSKTGVVTITASSGGKSDSIEITLTDPSDAYVYSITIVEGSGVVKDYYNNTSLDTTGLSVTATLKSNNVGGWTKNVENFTSDIEWSLDRENGFVIACYDNSETVYDLMEVTIHNTDKPTQFVLQYSGETVANTSTSYNLGDYITVPSNWSVTATKNTPQNNVGLNTAGQFKLYSDKTKGNGNSITVESNDEAVIVKSVSLSISGSCAHQVTKTGGSVVSGSGEVYQINASSFTIKNTHTGGSTSTLSIISITVSYGYVDTFVAAQDFENEFIKRGIEYPEQSGPTGVPGVACLSVGEEGHLGYFDTAVSEYNKMADAQSRIWFASRAEFAKARERFQAWATANGKTITFNTTTGDATVSGSRMLAPVLQNMSNNSVILLVVISMVSVGAIGGYFFIRRRKENI